MTFLHKRNRRFETQLKAKERLACVVGIKRGRENYVHRVLVHLDFPFPLLLKCLLQDYKSSCGNVSSFFVYFQSRWNDLFGNAQKDKNRELSSKLSFKHQAKGATIRTTELNLNFIFHQHQYLAKKLKLIFFNQYTKTKCFQTIHV